MPYTDAAKNAMLTQLGTLATHLSLHSAYPGTTGTNEKSGGSPAYARQPVAWSAAAAGVLSLSASETFDVPAGDVAWYGLWSAVTGGTFYGSLPAGSAARKPFSVDDIATDVLDSEAHGFTNGQTVVAWGSNLPGGLAEGTVYFVRDVTADSLKLAATSGGAAINLTTIGDGWLQRIVVETFAAQGQYQVSDVDVDLNA